MAFVAVGWNTASRGPAIREGGAAAELPIPEARLTRVNAAQAAAVESKTGSRVYKFAGLAWSRLSRELSHAGQPTAFPPAPAGTRRAQGVCRVRPRSGVPSGVRSHTETWASLDCFAASLANMQRRPVEGESRTATDTKSFRQGEDS